MFYFPEKSTGKDISVDFLSSHEILQHASNSAIQNTGESNFLPLTILGIEHKRINKNLNGKVATINILKVNPKTKNFEVKPTYGEYLLNEVKSVSDFAAGENAIAAVNASFFKPDIGAPLGVSIINGELLTGPVYKRVVFGVTEDKNFLMNRLDISGKILIGNNLKLNLHNFNQPDFSRFAFTVFTDRWGKKTPHLGTEFCHIIVKRGHVHLVKQSSVEIPEGGYVVVGPRWMLRGKINKGDKVEYSVNVVPEEWKNVKSAISGGPYLVKKGQIFVDRQHFTDKFLYKKEPRTAIGFTKDGTLLLVTVDGRKEGISEGATMHELAGIMRELGAYYAMNLDGGSSTQMFYKGQLVNTPTVKGGGKVTNALLIIPSE